GFARVFSVVWSRGMPPGRRAAPGQAPRGTAMLTATDNRTRTDQDRLKDAILRHITYSLVTTPAELSPREAFQAVALAVRDRLVEGRLQTQQRYRRADPKRLYYLSVEFLIGRSLANNLVNLGLWEPCRAALAELGQDLNKVVEAEPDAGLGNGGLGRLAACFLDSLAT